MPTPKAECAVDYDDCIGNDAQGFLTASQLMEKNKALVQHMRHYLHSKTKGLPANHRHVSVGSARQSHIHDAYATAIKESTLALPIYPEIAEAVGDTLFDTFLLADIKQGLQDGISYQRLIDIFYQGQHAHWSEDPSKISILYAKIHRAACFNPNGPAFVAFYDNNTDILGILTSFFRQHRYLIPKNVTLDLFQYESGQSFVEDFASITGDSSSLGIDEDYRRTTQYMGQVIDAAGDPSEGAASMFDIAELHLEDKILEIRAKKAPVPQVPPPSFAREAFTFFGFNLLDGCLPSAPVSSGNSKFTPT